MIIIYPLEGCITRNSFVTHPSSLCNILMTQPPSFAINWQSIFYTLLYTLPAKTNPHSATPENHMIPLFTHPLPPAACDE